MVNRAPCSFLRKDGNGEEMELVLEILHCWPPTCRGMTSRSCPEKGEEVEPLFRRLNQAQEQQRAGQTGRDGKRCAALLGLTRRGWHPAGRGQLPGSTTGKATTEALAVDAICLPSDMLQDRIWGRSRAVEPQQRGDEQNERGHLSLPRSL